MWTFTHIFQGYSTEIPIEIRLPQCPRRNHNLAGTWRNDKFIITSNDVATSFRRQNDAIVTSYLSCELIKHGLVVLKMPFLNRIITIIYIYVLHMSQILTSQSCAKSDCSFPLVCAPIHDTVYVCERKQSPKSAIGKKTIYLKQLEFTKMPDILHTAFSLTNNSLGWVA